MSNQNPKYNPFIHQYMCQSACGSQSPISNTYPIKVLKIYLLNQALDNTTIIIIATYLKQSYNSVLELDLSDFT